MFNETRRRQVEHWPPTMKDLLTQLSPLGLDSEHFPDGNKIYRLTPG